MRKREALMSERGRALFERFIAQRLPHPELRDARVEKQVSELLEMAEANEIAWIEIVEEVGEISEAITAALMEGRKEIK